MAKFPALEPLQREWTLPEFPVTQERNIRFLHGLVPANQQLTLTYINLTNAEAALIREHYRAQQGSYLAFTLSDEVMNGLSQTTILQPYSLLWRYEGQPSETHKDAALYDITVELRSVSGAEILAATFTSTWTGTLTNCFSLDGSLYASFDNTETWQSHFTSRSWTSPNDQKAAGYEYYLMPTQNTGSYSEIFDAGGTIAASNISATLTYANAFGSTTVAPTISVRLLTSDPWIDYVGVTSVYATNFRYVKVAYDFTSAGGNDLLKATSLVIKLQA